MLVSPAGLRYHVRLRDLTSVTCYTKLKRELTRSGYALYTQVRVRMYV